MSSLFGLLELTSKKGTGCMLEVDKKRRNHAWQDPLTRAEQRNQIFACFINNSPAN